MGQICPDGRVEQCAREAGRRGGDDQRRHGVHHSEETEPGGPQRAPRDDERLVAEPVGQGSADEEHPLLREVPHPEHQTHDPDGEPEIPGEVGGEVGDEHVEADVDRQLVDQQQLHRPLEGTELPEPGHWSTPGPWGPRPGDTASTG